MLQAKRPQLRRLQMIDEQLKQNRFPTVPDLAQLAEVDPRTVRRDIDFLRDQCHAPIAYCHRRRGWHYTEPTFQLPNVQITEGELIALFLAEQVLRQHKGSPFEPQLAKAIKKLIELLPDEVSVRWDAVAQSHSFLQTAVSLQDADILDCLTRAAFEKRQLRIDYWTASRDVESSRVVDPWHLACLDGAWYLIAWCHTRKETLTFAPARIRAIEKTGETFSVPADFNINEFLKGAFQVYCDSDQRPRAVRLRFKGLAATIIAERNWHPSQILTRHPDGTVLLELSLHSLVEVRRMVLSWGGDCEVLAPQELREDIRREARRMLAASSQHSPVQTRSQKRRPLPPSAEAG